MSCDKFQALTVCPATTGFHLEMPADPKRKIGMVFHKLAGVLSTAGPAALRLKAVTGAAATAAGLKIGMALADIGQEGAASQSVAGMTYEQVVQIFKDKSKGFQARFTESPRMGDGRAIARVVTTLDSE